MDFFGRSLEKSKRGTIEVAGLIYSGQVESIVIRPHSKQIELLMNQDARFEAAYSSSRFNHDAISLALRVLEGDVDAARLLADEVAMSVISDTYVPREKLEQRLRECESQNRSLAGYVLGLEAELANLRKVNSHTEEIW